MTKPRVLQIGSIAGAIQANAALRENYDVIALWEAQDRQACLEAAKDVEVIITTARYGCPSDVILALPSLKAICSWGVGYDLIDLELLKQRNVQLSTTPDVLNDCVADEAWALLMASARHIVQGDQMVRANDWENGTRTLPLGTRVAGKKLGILGLGRIGQAIAKRSHGFDMEVRYHNRNPRNDVPYEYSKTLLELAQWADFLVIASVGGEETRGIVSREVLRALGPKGIVVNIARGSVIDEQGMIELLQSGELGGAGLDVFEHEPRVPDALKQMPQVVLMPHVASATHETRQDMETLLLENLRAYFAGEGLVTPLSLNNV